MKSRLGLLAIFLVIGGVSFGLWWWQRSTSVDGSDLISPLGVISGSNPKNNGMISPIGPTVEPTPAKKQEKLLEQLKTQVATASGTYAVYVYELKGKRGFGFNEHSVMSGASILKVPAMASVLRKVGAGEASMSGTVVLQEADRRLGAGPLQYEKAGKAFTYEKLVYEMGNKSDNTAWVMVNRDLGRTYITDTMKTLGMVESNYGEVDTTASDVAKMFATLYVNGVPGVSWKNISGYLVDSIYEDRISVVVPNDVRLVHKVGTLADAWMDAGVVEDPSNPFVLVIMNTGVKVTEAQTLVPKLAKLVWNFERGL